jgi:hypothetical protein
MDNIDKVSIAVLVIYLFGISIAGFWGVFRTLRQSSKTGKSVSAVVLTVCRAIRRVAATARTLPGWQPAAVGQ